jgi:hypothetical protein
LFWCEYVSAEYSKKGSGRRALFVDSLSELVVVRAGKRVYPIKIGIEEIIIIPRGKGFHHHHHVKGTTTTLSSHVCSAYSL